MEYVLNGTFLFFFFILFCFDTPNGLGSDRNIDIIRNIMNMFIYHSSLVIWRIEELQSVLPASYNNALEINYRNYHHIYLWKCQFIQPSLFVLCVKWSLLQPYPHSSFLYSYSTSTHKYETKTGDK